MYDHQTEIRKHCFSDMGAVLVQKMNDRVLMCSGTEALLGVWSNETPLVMQPDPLMKVWLGITSHIPADSTIMNLWLYAKLVNQCATTLRQKRVWWCLDHDNDFYLMFLLSASPSIHPSLHIQLFTSLEKKDKKKKKKILFWYIMHHVSCLHCVMPVRKDTCKNMM